MLNQEFINDVGKENLLIMGSTGSGKTLIFKDMLLQAPRMNSGKTLVISPFDELKEVVDYLYGNNYELSGILNGEIDNYNSLTGVSIDTDNFPDNILYLIEDFKTKNQSHDLVIYLDGLTYSFGSDECLTDVFKLIESSPEVQFIVNTQYIPTEYSSVMKELFPVKMFLNLSRLHLNELVQDYELAGLLPEYDIGEGYVKGRDKEYNFRYTFCDKFRNLFFIAN